MRWRVVRVIALREFLSTVRRREFLFVTFGLPLLYFVLGVGTMTLTTRAVGEAQDREAARVKVVGWLDRSGLLDRDTLVHGDEGGGGKVLKTEDEGKAAVKTGDVRAFVVVSADFEKSGAVTLYLPEHHSSLFQDAGDDTRAYLPVLRRSLLAGRIAKPLVERAVVAPEATRLQYDAASGGFQTPDPLQAISRFAVPYVMALLLVISVLFSSSYLLHGIVEEKENRVIEVLLSAASHEDLLLGKLFGLGAAGLAQLGLWLITGGSTGIIAAQVVQRFAVFTVSPAVIGTGALFFVLGFGFYAALMAGIGSFGTSWRESQQISGMLVFLLVMPLMVIPVFLASPDGALARTLSYLPPTAPIAMMLRVAAGGSSVIEVLLAAAVQATAVLLVVRLSARLFRLSLLLYGQRPTPGEVLRWLRYKETMVSAD